MTEDPLIRRRQRQVDAALARTSSRRRYCSVRHSFRWNSSLELVAGRYSAVLTAAERSKKGRPEEGKKRIKTL